MPSAGNVILLFWGGWLVQTDTSAFDTGGNDAVSISNINLTAFFYRLPNKKEEVWGGEKW